MDGDFLPLLACSLYYSSRDRVVGCPLLAKGFAASVIAMWWARNLYGREPPDEVILTYGPWMADAALGLERDTTESTQARHDLSLVWTRQIVRVQPCEPKTRRCPSARRTDVRAIRSQ